MQYAAQLAGETALIQHSGTGLDPETPISREIARIASKKTSQRTEAENQRLRDLEVVRSLWLDENGAPTVPAAVVRSTIEVAARKFKEGPAVREGLLVLASSFEWDAAKYGTADDLDAMAKKLEFTVPVRVGQSRILRTRAKFDPPWSVKATIEVDDDLVDAERLKVWLETAGRRAGFGDWRPAKSGTFGRFTLVSLTAD